MRKKHTSTWYFIDYENHPFIPYEELKEQDCITLFLGQQQKSLSVDLMKKLLHIKKTIDIEIIQVSGQSPNNVDFHLSYELGKQHEVAKYGTLFVVISKDKGFDNLINYINTQGRQCKRVV